MQQYKITSVHDFVFIRCFNDLSFYVYLEILEEDKIRFSVLNIDVLKLYQTYGTIELSQDDVDFLFENFTSEYEGKKYTNLWTFMYWVFYVTGDYDGFLIDFTHTWLGHFENLFKQVWQQILTRNPHEKQKNTVYDNPFSYVGTMEIAGVKVAVLKNQSVARICDKYNFYDPKEAIDLIDFLKEYDPEYLARVGIYFHLHSTPQEQHDFKESVIKILCSRY